ncbi:IS3 family transposase [Lactiplantibacillus plantarum]|nr:IS3 family transposase [Lactiplantibacillus plantarum]
MPGSKSTSTTRINWYNYKRRQETLNGMTPKEFRNHAILKTA